jgi:citrate lyase beta subunit
LFKSTTVARLGELARKSAADYGLAEALGLSAAVAASVAAKLEREPVEDFRIDFEDGFGVRPDEEEDAEARRVARELATATPSRCIGVRIKPGLRGLRTLRILLDSLEAPLPDPFVVTLPKVTAPEQVAGVADALLHYPHVFLEIMVETPVALRQLPQLVAASDGRCTGIHLGAYDYLASLGIAVQDLQHPACDFARNTIQTTLAGTGIWFSDGATQQLPLPPHRGADRTAGQRADNAAVVHQAWKLHYANVRRALIQGFYQGWDLHPAQIPARFAAVHTFYMEGLPQIAERLKSFVAAAARTSEVRGAFDDAATGRLLLNYVRRAQSCGLAQELDSEAAQLETLLKLDARNH